MIANELLEALVSYPFCATELRIVLFVIRKTYGWKKKKAFISCGMISRELKADIRFCKRLMRRLVEDNVLIKEKLNRQNIIGLNKDYKSWRLWKTPVCSGAASTGFGGLPATKEVVF